MLPHFAVVLIEASPSLYLYVYHLKLFGASISKFNLFTFFKHGYFALHALMLLSITLRCDFETSLSICYPQSHFAVILIEASPSLYLCIYHL